MRRPPSKWNGLVTTPTVRMPISRATRAITGAAPSGAAAHAGGDEHHMRACQMVANFLERLLGRGAADFGLGARAKALGDLQAHLNDPLGARRGQRLRVGVGDDEVDPDEPETIMLFTALPPAPPTPQTMIRGFNSRSSGAFRLIDIAGLILLDARRRRFKRVNSLWLAKRERALYRSHQKLCFQPPPDARDIAFVRRAVAVTPRARLGMFESRDLRIDHQADRGGERRALGAIRASPSTPSGRPIRAWLETTARASSGRPVNWQAPPVEHQPAAGVGALGPPPRGGRAPVREFPRRAAE